MKKTLLLITRGAAVPKRQLEKDYYIQSIYLWTEKGEQHAINYLICILKFLIACSLYLASSSTATLVLQLSNSVVRPQLSKLLGLYLCWLFGHS